MSCSQKNKISPCHIQIPEPRPVSCMVGCLYKTCKLRRIVTISGIMLCTLLTFELIMHKPSLLIAMNVMPEESKPRGEGRSVKDLPGYFMSGKYPYNNTFCKFNYGLPNKLDWGKFPIDGTPEHGMKSPYRVIYNAIERTMLDSHYTAEQVTYSTHVTPEYLYHIVEIARFWDGPISVAAFVPDYDMEMTMKLFSHLCKCYDGMSKVSVHLVYPKEKPPIFIEEEIAKIVASRNDFRNKTLSTNTKTEVPSTDEGLDIDYKEVVTLGEEGAHLRTRESIPLSGIFNKHRIFRDQSMINLEFNDCSNPDLSTSRSFRSRYGLTYPINVCRNVARNASTTPYNLVSDVELIPSEGLATRFSVMLHKHNIAGKNGRVPVFKLAFVIPVFEVDYGEGVPRNKSSLQQLYADGKVVYFHRWVCNHCQKIPDLQTWIKEDPGAAIKPFTVTKRQFPYHRWEPIYIGTKHTPWYSETLSWEGKQDKMTQMLEMCLRSYDFVVIDGAFLCHSPGIKTKSKKKGRSWRYRHEQVNTRNYDQIVKSLAERYPPNIKCRIG